MKWNRRALLGGAVLATLLAVVTAPPVDAEIGSLAVEPAATLLLPYFEVDLDDPQGLTTLFSVHNASDAPALVHVTLWTDWGFPTLAFDMYLTGYDVTTINLRSIFDGGNIPITADQQSDPGDSISPQGPLSMDGSFPSCQNFFPFFTNPVLEAFHLERIRNGHTGQRVASLNDCVGRDLGDNVARGYITLDNVNQCSLVLDPGQFDYFQDGGAGIASNRNQLWGDYFIIDPLNNFAQGDNLVHIEASDDLNAAQVPLLDPNTKATVATVANSTGYTFYGRYSSGMDNREPLGTVWAARYLNGGVFSGGTSLTVWRDSTADDLSAGGNNWGCGVGPSWFPLNETEIVAFDLQEDALEFCFFVGGVIAPPNERDPACFPSVAGRHRVGEGDLDVPFAFGWMYLNLNLPPDAAVGDVDFGTSGNIAQSWVSTTHDASGLFSVGLPAIELLSAFQDVNPDITP